MARKNESFENIKIQGLVYENLSSNMTDTLTAGRYPSINSVCQITDNAGTAEFLTAVNCGSVTTSNLTVNGPGVFNSIQSDSLTATSIISSSLTINNAVVTGDSTSGFINAKSVRLGNGSLDLSGSLLWTDASGTTDVLGWKNKLAQKTQIHLLDSTATNEDIAITLNALLTILKTQGVFIT